MSTFELRAILDACNEVEVYDSGGEFGFIKPAFTFNSLPIELQLMILEKLDYHDLKCLQRVSKRMRQLLSHLSTQLFQAHQVLSVTSLAELHERSGNRYLSLSLHPLFHQLSFTCGQTFDEAKINDISGFGPKSFKLARIKARFENATSPALNAVTLKSWYDHGQFGVLDAQGLDTRVGCNKVHRLRGREGAALTMEELLRGFIDSLDDFCLACREGLEFVHFEGWDVKRIAEDKSEVLLERPIWGEREPPNVQQRAAGGEEEPHECKCYVCEDSYECNCARPVEETHFCTCANCSSSQHICRECAARENESSTEG